MYIRHLLAYTAAIAALCTPTSAGNIRRNSTQVGPSPSSGLLQRRFSVTTDHTNDFCIDFTFDNPNWYFTRQPPWGNEAGTFGSLKNGRMCLPRTDIFGGALFIGAHPGPIANTTKLECFFGASNTANCDISLVDGFSLPVTCTVGEQRMGGNIDLWSTGVRCENESNKHLGICTNTREDRAERNVPEFFQPAIQHGNSYCIWTRCTQNPFFPVHHKLKCHIGATRLSPGSL